MPVHVEGMAKLNRRTIEAATLTIVAAEDAQRDGAEAVAEQWRQGAPVETGAYRDSIQAADDAAYSDIDYAPFVEFGTFSRPAQPAGSRAGAVVANHFGRDVAVKIARSLRRL
jgi:hypothetical protein